MTVAEFKKNGKGIFIPEEIYYNTNLTPEQRMILAIEKHNDIQFKDDEEEADFHGISVKRLKNIRNFLRRNGYME